MNRDEQLHYAHANGSKEHYHTACGSSQPPDSITDDKSAVTCEPCKRRVFGERIEIARRERIRVAKVAAALLLATEEELLIEMSRRSMAMWCKRGVEYTEEIVD